LSHWKLEKEEKQKFQCLIGASYRAYLAINFDCSFCFREQVFHRGLVTNLHALGVEDKTIQAILRHSNVGLTMNVYVKSVSESQTAALDSLGEKLGTYNELATKRIQ
jgi:hypothetical protein